MIWLILAWIDQYQFGWNIGLDHLLLSIIGRDELNTKQASVNIMKLSP